MQNQLVYKDTIKKLEKNINSSFSLMQRAGKKSAQYINNNFKKKNILIICGIGGNGGDGFILAQELYKKYKWKVQISILGNIEQIKGDALKAFKKLSLKTLDFEKIDLKTTDYIVDAIYGIGLSRTIKNNTLKVIKTIHKTKIPIIALDMPSGVDCNNGSILGFSLNCLITLTFSYPKVGQFLLPGAIKCGKIIVLDIGIPKTKENKFIPNIYLNSKNLWVDKINWPKENDHKYSRGYTLVIGGPREMTGASRLTAISAQRAGSGIVVLAADNNSKDIYYKTLLSQIVKNYKNRKEFNIILNDPRIDVIIIGPGLEPNNHSKIKIKDIIKTNKKIILDAGAITCFKNDIKNFAKLIQNNDVIITPHEGEFKILFPRLKGSIVDKAIYAAKKLNSIVVLKGATTIIASANKKVIINQYGSKWLATAGSGDVLTGLIGGLISNKMEIFYAAACATWLHREAGIALGPGLIADDIPDILPKIIKKII